MRCTPFPSTGFTLWLNLRTLRVLFSAALTVQFDGAKISQKELIDTLVSIEERLPPATEVKIRESTRCARAAFALVSLTAWFSYHDSEPRMDYANHL